MKQIFLFFLLTSCSYQMSAYIDHAHALSEKFYRTYRDENQLAQDGSGGGSADGVTTVAGSFISSRRINIEEARRLFVRGVERCCGIFNQDLAIRPYLRNFPFTHSNVNITLSFYDPISGLPMSQPYISFVYLIKDNVIYDCYDKSTDSYVDCYEEPYAEALRIVQEEREQAQQNQTQKLN